MLFGFKFCFGEVMGKKAVKNTYKQEYAEQLVKWFRDAPLFLLEQREVFLKKSDKIEQIDEKNPATCPTFVRFADENGITIENLEKWRKEKPEFNEAYNKAKLYQEEWLMNAAGLGFYNSSMSIMALKANHGWVEKQDAKKFDTELKQVLVRFVEHKVNEEKQQYLGGGIEEDNSKYTGDFCSVDDEKISD